MHFKEEAREYIQKLAARIWVFVVSVLLAIVGATQDVLQSVWNDFVMPPWVWVATALVGLVIAQYLTWRDMRKERDKEYAEKERIRRYDVNQQTLSELALLRDQLISHQNVEIKNGTHLGQWIEQYRGIRGEVNKILQEKVSYAEHRAYDHIGLFTLYGAPRYPGLSDNEYSEFLNWRSRVARDHKWLEKFIHDYGRYRMRADLSAISGSEPLSETDTNSSR